MQCVCVFEPTGPLAQQGTPDMGAGGQPRVHSPKGDGGMRASNGRFCCHYLTVQLQGSSSASQETGQHHDELFSSPGPSTYQDQQRPRQVNMARVHHPHWFLTQHEAPPRDQGILGADQCKQHFGQVQEQPIKPLWTQGNSIEARGNKAYLYRMHCNRTHLEDANTNHQFVQAPLWTLRAHPGPKS